MKNIVIYVHGKGGSTAEAEHYKPLFPDSEVQPLAGYRNWNQTTLGITRYIIGHSLKVQADMSYNTRSRSIDPNYNRWEIRFQLELGL